MVRKRARHHRGRLRHAEEEVAAIRRRRTAVPQRRPITRRATDRDRARNRVADDADPERVAHAGRRRHANEKSLGSIDRTFSKVMVSSGPPRPEWITHWLVAPIWVNVAPCRTVPKPTNCNASPPAAPPPSKSVTR